MAVAAPPAPQTDACAICLEQCTRRTSLDGCTHAFCYDCIKTWTNTTNTCPQCRTRIHKLTEQTRGARKRGKSENIADKDVTEANWVHTLYDTDEEEYAFLAEAYGLSLNPRLGGYVDDGGFVVEDDVVSYEASQESTHSSSEEEEEEDEFLSLSPTTLRELGCSDLIMENIRQAQRNRREARQYCRAMRRESERHLPAPPPPMRTRKRASQEPPDEDEEEEESYPSDSNDSDNSSSSAPSAPPPARKRRRRAR